MAGVTNRFSAKKAKEHFYNFVMDFYLSQGHEELYIWMILHNLLCTIIDLYLSCIFNQTNCIIFVLFITTLAIYLELCRGDLQ